MDNEMIERVAIAIKEAEWGKRTDWKDCAEDFKEIKIEQAKAAIKAMREPTEKMKRIVTDDMVITDNCYYCGGHIEGWRTMIDSITND